MKLSPKQSAALDRVGRWYQDKSAPQVLRLFGYAGSGKTTLAKYFAELTGARTLYAAFTGKAASVLRSKGCSGATTLHSLIYRPAGDPMTPKQLEALRERVKQAKATGAPHAAQLAEQLVRAEQDQHRTGPRFALNTDSDVAHADLVIIDECFVAGTLVDTPHGAVAIETLQEGDSILNALGEDRVCRTMRRKADRVVQIDLGGKTITCSADHPFFTERGLRRASELEPGDSVCSTAEAMRRLREALHTIAEKQGPGSVLLSSLQYDLVEAVSGVHAETLYGRESQESRGRAQAIPDVGRSACEGANRARAQDEPDGGSGGTVENLAFAQGIRTSSGGARRKREGAYEATAASARSIAGRLETGARGDYRRKAALLQNRSSGSRTEDWNRSGRSNASRPEGSGSGSSKDSISSGTRVGRVEILESRDSRLDQFRDADGQLYLYDLEAARHHSFSVNGCLVHNCSMVDARVGRDLESFGTKLLILGDPAQLPPVFGEGYFMDREPDILLDEIHRQALDSPILQLATLAREGKSLPYGTIGEGVEVLRYGDPSLEARALATEMILVGRNKTRHACNTKIRRLLGRGDKPAPVPGDRVVCRRNNHDLGLLNGSTWTVEHSVPDFDQMTVKLEIRSDDGQDVVECVAWLHPFLGREGELNSFVRREKNEVHFGNALTVHSSQGSQWNDVLVFDESRQFGKDASKHLYTALTRAAQKLTVVQ